MSTNPEVGIVGLPNVGKSTLFNAITKAGAEAANYPFCTIEPNVGVVEVPDERLKRLSEIYKPKRILPTAMRFVDIAGLVKGASCGEGLGNKFLAHIRQVDAVAQVVRGFEDENITHVEGGLNPLRDIEIINTELCLADIESVEKRIERIQKLIKSGDKKAETEKSVLLKTKEILGEAIPLRRANFSEDEKGLLKDLNLLTLKPALYVVNINEDDIGSPNNNKFVQTVREYALAEQAEAIAVSAKVEAEIAELDAAEAADFLESLGAQESGLNQLIKASYKLLGLITFLTVGEQEVRAWTIKQWAKAPQAGGKIHSDIERGFIRAEIVSYSELAVAGTYATAREKGLVRLEGKDYVMQDGDVTYFRFNV